MLTLTIRHVEGDTPEAAAVKLAHAWRMLRQVLTRLYKVKFPFLAVFEKHPSSGRPHLHILLRSRFIDVRVIRGFMTKQLDSPQVWIEHFKDSRQAAAYVSKYVQKAPTKFGNCKRYWCSQDYRVAPKQEPEDDTDDPVWWTISSYSPQTVARMAQLDGVDITLVEGRYIIRGSWEPW